MVCILLFLNKSLPKYEYDLNCQVGMIFNHCYLLGIDLTGNM